MTSGLVLPQGFFEGGELLTAKVFRDVFCPGDDANKAETGFGIGGEVVGKGFGVAAAADDDDFEGGATVFLQGENASPADKATEKTKEGEATEDGVKRHNTDREKINVKEEVVANDSHHTNKGGEESY